MTGAAGAARTGTVSAVELAVAPAALVAVHVRTRLPGAPAVKVTLLELAPEVRVPPVMDHEKVQPGWGETEAV